MKCQDGMISGYICILESRALGCPFGPSAVFEGVLSVLIRTRRYLSLLVPPNGGLETFHVKNNFRVKFSTLRAAVND